MRLDLLNVQIKGENESINLKKLYDAKFKTKSFPLSIDIFTIHSIEVCADNKGCNPKKVDVNGKSVKNKLVLYKNKDSNVRTKLANDESKYVYLNIHGKVKIGNVLENINLRVPPSLSVGCRLGLSEQTQIKPGVNNAPLNTLLKKIKDFTVTLLDLKQPKISVSQITAGGTNVFKNHSNSNNRLKHKIKNFLQVMRLLDTKVPTHYLDYNQTNKKTFGNASFKFNGNGDKLPTVNITSWGYMDIKGAKTLEEINKVVSIFQTASNSIYSTIVFDETSVKPKSVRKGLQTTKTCSLRNPAPINGKCPNGYAPRVNPKLNKKCCYKQGKQAKQQEYSSVKVLNIPYYNGSKQNFFIKGKKFNCGAMLKNNLRSIGKRVGSGFIIKGSKQELCNDIKRLLKESVSYTKNGEYLNITA